MAWPGIISRAALPLQCLNCVQTWQGSTTEKNGSKVFTNPMLLRQHCLCFGGSFYRDTKGVGLTKCSEVEVVFQP